MKHKTAKDLAFERERLSLRKQIKDLTAKNAELETVLSAVRSELDQARDWVRRLLEYMDLSEEDLQKRIKNEEKAAELAGTLSSLLGFSARLPFHY